MLPYLYLLFQDTIALRLVSNKASINIESIYNS